MTEAKTYKMKMRVVRSAPYFDTLNVDSLEVEAYNASDAEKIAQDEMRHRYPDSYSTSYAVSKRRVSR
jgi:hypothetical protein